MKMREKNIPDRDNKQQPSVRNELSVQKQKPKQTRKKASVLGA